MTREEYFNTKGGRAFMALAQKYNCGLCKKKFEKPWAYKQNLPWPNNVTVSPEIAFHWEDTHGFPHDYLVELVATALRDVTPVDSQYRWKLGDDNAH